MKREEKDIPVHETLTPERLEALEGLNQALIAGLMPLINNIGQGFSNAIITEAEKPDTMFQDYREPINATFNVGISIAGIFIGSGAGMIGGTRGNDVIAGGQMWNEIEPQLKAIFMKSFTAKINDPALKEIGVAIQSYGQKKH